MWPAEHRIALIHNLCYRAAQPLDPVRVTITIHNPPFASLASKNYFKIVIETTDDIQTDTFPDILTDIRTYPSKLPVVFVTFPTVGMRVGMNPDDDELEEAWWRPLSSGEPPLETTYTYVVLGRYLRRIEYTSNRYRNYEMPANDILNALNEIFPS
jgi:hypothetical protein